MSLDYLQILVDAGLSTSDCAHILYGSAMTINATRMIEVGVRHGISTRALLLAAREMNGHLWSVDIRPCLDAKSAVANWNLSKHWTFTQQDSRSFLRDWNRGPVDLIFIDSGHRYELTLAELRLSAKLVRAWGSIILHDTLITSCPEGPVEVAQAVKAFLKTTSKKCKYQELGTRYGLGKVTLL